MKDKVQLILGDIVERDNGEIEIMDLYGIIECYSIYEANVIGENMEYDSNYNYLIPEMCDPNNIIVSCDKELKINV